MFKGLTIDTIPTASAHIDAYDQSLIYDSITGGDAVHELFSNLSATTVSANKVRIAAGVLSIQGHFAYVAYGTTESFTIENGQTGYERYDLLCAKFERVSGIDTMSLVTVKGTPAVSGAMPPTYTAQDLTQGGTVRLFPLYEVRLNGLTIVTVRKLFTVLKPLSTILESLKATISSNFIVQTVGNVQTLTYNFDRSIPLNYSSEYGVYLVSVQLGIPTSFTPTTNIEIEINCPNNAVYMAKPVSYDPNTHQLSYIVFAFANLGTQNVSISLMMRGAV